MVTYSQNFLSITGHAPLYAFLVGLCLLFAPAVFAQSNLPPSSDGKYEAVRVGSGDDVHFQVKEVKTGRVVLTTYAQYPGNKVKAGVFSPDAKEFAAAYHYGHDGNYTWIGIWSLETGKLLRTKKEKDFLRELSPVFKQ